MSTTEKRGEPMTSASVADTVALGRRLGEVLSAGDAVGLVGDLGAGKTHFVQALAAGLEVPEAVRVTSPTFTLVNIYQGGRHRLVHADLYRLERASELVELGLDELIGSDAVVAIEWSDRFPALPADTLIVELAVVSDTERRLTPITNGPESEALWARWRLALTR